MFINEHNKSKKNYKFVQVGDGKILMWKNEKTKS